MSNLWTVGEVFHFQLNKKKTNPLAKNVSHAEQQKPKPTNFFFFFLAEKSIYHILEKTTKTYLAKVRLGLWMSFSMAYFKPSYGVNGLGIPMGPMDAASLHHSMGYSGERN